MIDAFGFSVILWGKRPKILIFSHRVASGEEIETVRIRSVEAFPISTPLPAGERVTLGIGTTVKRDTVIVKVTTDEGLVGYGESHHGRAPGTDRKGVV